MAVRSGTACSALRPRAYLVKGSELLIIQQSLLLIGAAPPVIPVSKLMREKERKILAKSVTRKMYRGAASAGSASSMASLI